MAILAAPPLLAGSFPSPLTKAMDAYQITWLGLASRAFIIQETVYDPFDPIGQFDSDTGYRDDCCCPDKRLPIAAAPVGA